jgi:dGTPase
VPRETATEIAVLKGIAAHYVMQSDHRMALQERQRQLIEELVVALVDRGADGLDPMYAGDWRAASDDAARLRVVVDQVASLTDASALTWHARLA